MMQRELEDNRKSLASERIKLEKLVEQSDSLDQKRIKQLARVYGAMRAAEAARLRAVGRPGGAAGRALDRLTGLFVAVWPDGVSRRKTRTGNWAYRIGKTTARRGDDAARQP